jgi:hypothetical protein
MCPHYYQIEKSTNLLKKLSLTSTDILEPQITANKQRILLLYLKSAFDFGWLRFFYLARFRNF